MRLQILDFAHLMFSVDGADLDVVKMRAFQLLSQPAEHLFVFGAVRLRRRRLVICLPDRHCGNMRRK
jgi:hypothetical protein